MEKQQNLAWTISSPSKLTKVEFPIPRPGPNQALVRVSAASLNYRDVLIFHHSPRYPFIAKPNLIPCGDGAGTVVVSGPGSSWTSRVGGKVLLHPSTWLWGDVTGFAADKVMGSGDFDGVLQRYVVVDDEKINEAPKNLGLEEAATLPIAGLPAWNAVFKGPIECGPGSTIVTQGTGGLSCFAIQLATAVGATVIALSSSNAKLEVAKKLGAQHLINYRETPNWSVEIMRITNGRGADHVIDLGGSSTIQESLLSVRQGGLVSIVGRMSEPKEIPDPTEQLMMGGQTIRGVLGGSAEMVNEMVKFVEEHNIHPLISKVYEFDQALEAIQELERQEAVGKLVIKV